MLITVLSLIAVLSWPGTAPLHCRVTVGAGNDSSERCNVRVPSGHAIKPCADADRRAGHCADTGGARGRYVAWVVSSGPGRCRITDKGTKWKKGRVTAKLNAGAGGPSTCDLYVEVQ